MGATDANASGTVAIVFGAVLATAILVVNAFVALLHDCPDSGDGVASSGLCNTGGAAADLLKLAIVVIASGAPFAGAMLTWQRGNVFWVFAGAALGVAMTALMFLVIGEQTAIVT